jgi:type II secretory pathway pseudopilin PulG
MTSRVASLLTVLRRRLAAEHGGFLIEVVVSAALIVTAGAGVLAAMDAATDQTAQQRQQAVASNVAQAEMERVRSLKFASLINIDQTQPPVVIDNVAYTARTQTTWELQGTPGAAGCTTNARNPEALRVTTTVTWPRMRRRPVVLSSLIAAPAGSAAQRGAFLVQVTNRDGTGISGISVTLRGTSSGTPSLTGPTDTFGCVRFADLVPGNYDVEFAPPGYMLQNGDTAVDQAVTVVAGQTRNASFEIDRPGTAQIRFRYDDDGSVGTATAPTYVSLENSGLQAPKVLAVTAGGNFNAATGVLSTGPLYPFTGAYGAYADNCTSSRPSGGGQPLSLAIAPAGSLGSPTPLTMWLPPLDIRPRGYQVSTDQIYVRTACGNVLGPRPLASNGRLVDGFPYGTVEVCAVRPQNGSNPRRWVRRTNVANTDLNDATRVESSSFDLGDSNDYSTSSPACGGWLP